MSRNARGTATRNVRLRVRKRKIASTGRTERRKREKRFFFSLCNPSIPRKRMITIKIARNWAVEFLSPRFIMPKNDRCSMTILAIPTPAPASVPKRRAPVIQIRGMPDHFLNATEAPKKRTPISASKSPQNPRSPSILLIEWRPDKKETPVKRYRGQPVRSEKRQKEPRFPVPKK